MCGEKSVELFTDLHSKPSHFGDDTFQRDQRHHSIRKTIGVALSLLRKLDQLILAMTALAGSSPSSILRAARVISNASPRSRIVSGSNC
jgi:hypothetical protein